MHASNPRLWEAEAGRFLSLRPGLQSEFQDSQGYTATPCLGKTKQNKKTNNNEKQQQQQQKKTNPKNQKQKQKTLHIKNCVIHESKQCRERVHSQRDRFNLLNPSTV